jgi:hypothetical protein
MHHICANTTSPPHPLGDMIKGKGSGPAVQQKFFLCMRYACIFRSHHSVRATASYENNCLLTVTHICIQPYVTVQWSELEWQIRPGRKSPKLNTTLSKMETYLCGNTKNINGINKL